MIAKNVVLTYLEGRCGAQNLLTTAKDIYIVILVSMEKSDESGRAEPWFVDLDFSLLKLPRQRSLCLAGCTL